MAEFNEICSQLWKDDTFRGMTGAMIILAIVYVAAKIVEDATTEDEE